MYHLISFATTYDTWKIFYEKKLIYDVYFWFQIDKRNYGDNFCIAYECNKDRNEWEIGFDACLCPNLTYIAKDWSKTKNENFSDAQLCCPTSYVTTPNFGTTNKISCPFNESEYKTCESYPWDIEQDRNKIWENVTDSNIEICYGFSLATQAKGIYEDFLKGMVPTRYSCKTDPICNGKTPCIR